MPNYKRKLIILAVLILLVAGCNLAFPDHPEHVHAYDRFIFYPVQSVRIMLLSIAPVSIGDVLYVLGGLWAVVTMGRWVYYTAKWRSCKGRLGASVLRCINTVLLVYLIFVMGWGANYYKQPLRVYWQLSPSAPHGRHDTAALIAFDCFLIDRLNAFAPHYHTLSLKEINHRAIGYYRAYTDCRDKKGLGIKASLFGNIMERFDIEGYYNPFTGEGQINDELPVFMLPFTVCHEMAHQSGIAAEEDANLMAYALGTAAGDSTFGYSCYLNIWLYTSNRLYFRDSALANRLEATLNPLTRAQLDTLEQINNKYHSDITKYSGEVYDSYLRMQNQQEGIHSYGNVSSSAWQLELKRKDQPGGLISIP